MFEFRLRDADWFNERSHMDSGTVGYLSPGGRPRSRPMRKANHDTIPFNILLSPDACLRGSLVTDVDPIVVRVFRGISNHPQFIHSIGNLIGSKGLSERNRLLLLSALGLKIFVCLEL